VRFKEGYKPWNKGLTKETDPRIKGPIHQVGMSGKQHTQTSKDKMSIKHKGQKGPSTKFEEGCVPINKGKKGLQTAWNKGIPCIQITRDRIRVSLKKRCEEPGYLKRIMHRRTPSRPEQTFIDLSNEFQYVGNGQLIIDGKNPDFVCINDDHKLIEIWGDFYHKGQNPHDRIKFFNDRGYQCLVIWASELSNKEKIMIKIRKFVD
jgi:very-short-patch-repair endonuclease